MTRTAVLRVAGVLALVACAWLAAPDLLLALAPALLLAVALLAQRYPGARLLERIAARRRRGRVRPAAVRAPGAPTPPASPIRGGLLLARALAGRAPPPALLR